MKPPARRLGRGLGAFLDFGPVGPDGVARLPEASAESAAAPPPAPAPAAPPAPEPPPSPVAPPPVAETPAAPDESSFDDDMVVGLAFPDVELE